MNLEGNQEVEDTRGLRDTVEAGLKHLFAIFVIFFPGYGLKYCGLFQTFLCIKVDERFISLMKEL